MKREVRIKEHKEKREGISSLIFSLRPTVHPPILSSSINGYKEKDILYYQQNWNSATAAFNLSAHESI